MSEREELERLRKLKRLRELEAKAAGGVVETAPDNRADMPDFMRKQSFAGRAANMASAGGFADEISAAGVAALGGGVLGAVNAVKERDFSAIPRTIREEHKFIRGEQAARERAFEEENPDQALGADVLGSTVGLAKTGGAIAATQAGKLFAKAPASFRLATGGAGSSAVFSAGAAEDGEKLGAAKTGAAVGAVAGPVLNKAVGGLNHMFRKSNIGNAPTIERIKQRAQDLYAKAENSGVVIDARTTQRIAARMRDRMVKEGVRLPSGEFIDDSMTAIKGVDRTLSAFEGKEITPKQAMAIRQAFQNAAGSPNKKEARLGRILLQRYDGFLSRVAPELRQANALWHRASKAETVNRARTSKAETRVGQFSQSGIDNALRTEFRQILRDINSGKLKGFSEAEHEAVKRVANGTTTRNLAREVGKLAPNSSVGQLIGSGGVVGASAVGSPAAGAAVAGIMGSGYGGRALSNRLAVEQAETAELLIRAGVKEAFVQRLKPAQQEQVALLLAARLATSQADQDRHQRSNHQSSR